MVRTRFAKSTSGTTSASSTSAVTSRKRFAKIPRRVRVTQPTQSQLQAAATAKEVGAVDKQIAFQKQVISNIQANIDKRTAEANTASGDRVSFLRDRNDRDRDRINDVNRVIDNLTSKRTLVASGEVSGASVVKQSIVIGAESERVRGVRREDGTTLQRERALARKKLTTTTETIAPEVITGGANLVSPATKQPTFLEQGKDRGFITTTLDKLQDFSTASQRITNIASGSGGILGIGPAFVPPKVSGVGARIAPFLSPVGPALLVGEGAEKLLTPGGKRDIKAQQSFIEASGIGDIVVTKTPGLIGLSSDIKVKDLPLVAPIAEIGLGAFGIKSQLTKPIITKGAKPVSDIKSITQVKQGDDLSKVRFRIESKTPARLGTETNLFNKLIGRKPKTIQLTKARTDIVKTVVPLGVKDGKVTQSGLLLTTRKGAKIGKGTILRGTTGEISREEIAQLPKSQQFLFKKLAERNPIVSSDVKTTTGIVEAETFIKLGLGKNKKVDFLLPGKRIVRAEVASVSKEVAQGGGKTLIASEIAVKPGIRAFQRASGKPIVIKDLALVSQASDDAAGRIISSTTQQQVSRVSTKTLGAQQKAVAKAVKTITKPQARLPTTTTQRAVVADLAVKTSQRVGAATTLQPRIATATRTIGATSTIVKQAPITTTTTITTPTTATAQKTIPGLTTAQIVTTTSTTGTPFVPGFPTPTVPITPTKVPVIFGFKTKPVKALPKQRSFTAEVRRGGKFRKIGTRGSFASAFNLGSKRVKGTLAATFRIKGGTPFTGIILGEQLRKKKGKRNTFIEKKQFRLDTAGEIKGLKLARLKI